MNFLDLFFSEQTQDIQLHELMKYDQYQATQMHRQRFAMAQNRRAQEAKTQDLEKKVEQL